MQLIAILGAGYFAMEVTDLIGDIGGIEIIGYIVNQTGNMLCKPIITAEQLPDSVKMIGAMIAQERMSFIKEMEAHEFISVIHPSSSISMSAITHDGVVVNRLVAIASHARVGKHVVINRCVAIGHHTEIGNYSTIGPGVNIAGNVKIGENVFIGMGANILEGRRIGKGAYISAGSVVTKDVPDYGKMAGRRWTSQ